MTIFEFNQLPCYECMTSATKLSVGTKFLTGHRVIQQKESKQIGQGITYYEVIGEDTHGVVTYLPRYDILE